MSLTKRIVKPSRVSRAYSDKIGAGADANRSADQDRHTTHHQTSGERVEQAAIRARSRRHLSEEPPFQCAQALARGGPENPRQPEKAEERCESRLSQEEALNDITPIDLHKLATEIVAYLVPIALEKNIEIELVSPPEEVMILGNDTSLGILIRNLVDNAIRYTPEDGAVKVELIETKREVILRVTDTGPGIPVELRERVFERFFRILGTAAPGSGLGLAIVSQIAELHHAQIHLSTPSAGKGLQFDVAFPKFKENAGTF